MNYYINRNQVVTLTILILYTLFTISCSTNQTGNKPVVSELNNSWVFRNADSVIWRQAQVPGVVHLDLHQNNLIGEPFFRDNEVHQQWIDKKDWEYSLNFIVSDEIISKEKIQLIFYGLDTYADVYLNDSLLLFADNMFRTWKIDCKSILKIGSNELKVYFHSPIKVGIPLFDSCSYLLPAINDHSEIGGLENKKVSVFTRKAAYHYGWDWGPRFVTSGIWRPVNLIAFNELKLENVQFVNKTIRKESAEIMANFEVECTDNSLATIKILDENSQRVLGKKEIELYKGTNYLSLDFPIEKPKLWWCNGLGDPFLYKLSAEIQTKNGNYDKISVYHGIRKVELIREKDSLGASFYFKLNGVPVYAKGANYIPNDNFLPRVTSEKYTHIIQSAVSANFNMLRVWGGGIYENDIFYELCDKHGIMVWQDFMFACNMYPGDKMFLINVEQEFIENVKRLRNHPSIVLWCGNNEMLQAWHNWGWHEKNSGYKWTQEDSTKIWNDYLKIFHEIIPSVLAKLDTTRSYWPSSPAADINIPQNYFSGDYHYWKNRDQILPITVYEDCVGRFMSEYGLDSNPEFNSVKLFTALEDTLCNVRNYAGPSRAKLRDEEVSKRPNYLNTNFNNAKSFQMKLYVGQLLHSLVMNVAIESHRRSKPYNMGSLFWMINECWPVECGSAIDYYGRWKSEMYMAKKAFADVLISTPQKGDTLKVFIVSDRQTGFNSEVKLELFDFQGKKLWHHFINYHVQPNTSLKLFEQPIDLLLGKYDKKSVVLRMQVYEQGKLLSENFRYFVPFKDLQLQRPTIKSDITKTKEGYKIKLKTDVFAKSVFVTIEEPIGIFSDNFFELIPGVEKEIEFSSIKEVEDFQTKLEIYSLADSYL